MSIGLHIDLLWIYSIIWFLKASRILNMKVVPNDNFKFGGERVKQRFIPERNVNKYCPSTGINENGPQSKR